MKLSLRDLNSGPCPPPHTSQTLILVEWASHQGCVVVWLMYLILLKIYRKKNQLKKWWCGCWFGQFHSISIKFGPLLYIQSSSVYSQFGQLLNSGPLSLLWSILDHLSPVWSNSAHLVYFGPFNYNFLLHFPFLQNFPKMKD